MLARTCFSTPFLQFLSCLGLLFNATGCGDSNEPPPEQNPEIEWNACPERYVEGREGFECALMEMPLDHETPEGETIEVLTYKYEGRATTKKGQLWFLMGGPGDTNTAFLDPILVFAEAHPEWDFYSVEHRGIGASTRLGCPQESAGAALDWAACGEYVIATQGDRLNFFSTTQAAFDVGQAIEWVQQQKEKQPEEVFVFGVSYGTHWVQRYLQLFPEQASGVVLDSTIAPGGARMGINLDLAFDEVGRQLLEICGEDETCDSQMSAVAASPLDALSNVFQNIDDGQICSPLRETVTRTWLRNMLGLLLMEWDTRLSIPPLIKRIARCEDGDVAAVKNLFEGVPLDGGYTDYSGLLDSVVLATLVNLSEFEHAFRPDDESESGRLFFSGDIAVGMAEIAAANWPQYDADSYMYKTAETDIPLLILQGELDPQTPLDEALETRDNFDGPHQYFVSFPEVPHSVVECAYTNASIQRLAEQESDALLSTCGSQMLWDFLQNPRERPSDSCLDDLYRIDFSDDALVNQNMALVLFGTDTLWGGD